MRRLEVETLFLVIRLLLLVDVSMFRMHAKLAIGTRAACRLHCRADLPEASKSEQRQEVTSHHSVDYADQIESLIRKVVRLSECLPTAERFGRRANQDDVACL